MLNRHKDRNLTPPSYKFLPICACKSCGVGICTPSSFLEQPSILQKNANYKSKNKETEERKMMVSKVPPSSTFTVTLRLIKINGYDRFLKIIFYSFYSWSDLQFLVPRPKISRQNKGHLGAISFQVFLVLVLSVKLKRPRKPFWPIRMLHSVLVLVLVRSLKRPLDGYSLTVSQRYLHCHCKFGIPFDVLQPHKFPLNSRLLIFNASYFQMFFFK